MKKIFVLFYQCIGAKIDGQQLRSGLRYTLPWWLGEGGEGVKTTENEIHWPPCSCLTRLG
jgi:hypothetical protein